MEVIFIKNHQKNKIGDKKTVADGFATNSLIPNNIVIKATKENIAKLDAKIKKDKDDNAADILRIDTLKNKLESVELVIYKEVTPIGKPMGSISKLQIEKEFLEQHNIIINHKNIDFKYNKCFGLFDVPISLGKGVKAHLKLNVIKK